MLCTSERRRSLVGMLLDGKSNFSKFLFISSCIFSFIVLYFDRRGPGCRAIVVLAARQPKEILIDSDKLTLHGLSQYYINLEENQKTRKLTELMDILGTRIYVQFCVLCC